MLGQAITINGARFQIVGVAPENFHGVLPGHPSNEVWIPAMMIEIGYRWCNAFQFDCAPLGVIGRLPSGRKIEEAQAELSAIVGGVGADRKDPLLQAAFLDRATGLERPARNRYSSHLQLLGSVAGLLLLLACANIAGLLIARGIARRREIAVRLSIGATRARLIRQLLTESLVLGLMGGALGLLLSLGTRGMLLKFYSLSDEGRTNFYDIHIDPLILGISLLLAVGAAVLFGAVPAIQATRPDVALALKSDSSGGSGRAHLRGGLVTMQVALSLVLLVSAGLLAESVGQIETGTNFDPRGVALLRLRPNLINYSPARAQAFTRDAITKVESLPDVESVAYARGVGFVWLTCCTGFLPQQQEGAARASYHVIGPRYFSTLHVPLVAGREFDEHDRAGAPLVAIINQTFAARQFPDEPAIGRSFVADGHPLRVVGIVKDFLPRSLADDVHPTYYTPFWQSANETDTRLAVRVHGDPRAILATLRRAIGEVDPQVPVTEQLTMLDQVRGVYMQARLAAAVLLCASILALILSAVGLYGVIAFITVRRTKEIGVRIALGARPSAVRGLILEQAAMIAAPGIAIGLAGAFASTRLLGAWLYGVRAIDPFVFAAAAIALSVVAMAASWIPAHRAARLDPIAALRAD